jgi:hypothetical protein
VRVRSLLSLVALLVAAVVVLPAGGGAQTPPQLIGDVGPNDAFRISLFDASGKPVTHLDPGTYTLLVRDHSEIHNFDLFGPGVSVKTDVGFVGEQTFTLTLQDGTYRYVCDPHNTFMKGSFTVGAVATPPPPAKIAAFVGPGRKIGVKVPSGLTAGAATIVVSDRTAKDNFRLVGPGVAKATGVRFRGTVTWKVTLAAGRYTFRSDAHRTRLHGGFTVVAAATG